MEQIQETLRQAYWYMRKDYNDLKEVLNNKEQIINNLLSENLNLSEALKKQTDINSKLLQIIKSIEIPNIV